jgi:hypothetical protein
LHLDISGIDYELVGIMVHANQTHFVALVHLDDGWQWLDSIRGNDWRKHTEFPARTPTRSWLLYERRT